MSKFSSFGGLVAKHWKIAVIVVLVAGIGYYHWDRTRTIEALRADVLTLEQNIANCKGALGSQNSVIDQSATRSKEVIALEKAVTQAAIELEQAKTQAAIERLQGKELAATCDGAIQELIEGARGDLKWPE